MSHLYSGDFPSTSSSNDTSSQIKLIYIAHFKNNFNWPKCCTEVAKSWILKLKINTQIVAIIIQIGIIRYCIKLKRLRKVKNKRWWLNSGNSDRYMAISRPIYPHNNVSSQDSLHQHEKSHCSAHCKNLKVKIIRQIYTANILLFNRLLKSFPNSNQFASIDYVLAEL